MKTYTKVYLVYYIGDSWENGPELIVYNSFFSEEKALEYLESHPDLLLEELEIDL